MSEEGFFSRWSRRKRAAEADREVPEPPPQAAAPEPSSPVVVSPTDTPPPAFVPPGAGLSGPRAPEAPAAAPFDLASLPAIESLTAATDIRAFLRKEVPEALKRAALRRAWSLDPTIRDFVGPADYAWDYNAPDGVPGGALDLVGDVREMLAQVFGPEASPEDTVAAAPDAAGAPRMADATAEPPATGAAPNTATAAEAAPEDQPAAQGLLAAVPEEAPAEPSPPVSLPRRHGSALPS